LGKKPIHTGGDLPNQTKPNVATDTGEIATAVCVPSTQTKHFTHAARSLQKRVGFKPTATHSDTWPHKSFFWTRLFPNIKGRLGLFHFEKRILRTIRKRHIDFHDAVADLLDAVYEYEASDYEVLLTALKDGTLAPTGKKYTTTEIASLKATKYFRDRYGKYLRKRLRPPNTMVQRLDYCFCKYKVTASDDSRPARGRLDPSHGIPLFTPETKTAVDNCKEKATYLTDPKPLEEMHFPIPPNPNSRHNLTEYLSKRGESKLESFHDCLANFANSGMRDTLADNLHLAGTAQYNLAIRHKRSFLSRVTLEERKRLPAAWEKVVPYSNHSELWYINDLAADVGCCLPFPNAERLPPDNGERFFSQYIKFVNPMRQKYSEEEECLCSLCAQEITSGNNIIARVDPPPQPPQPPQPPSPTVAVVTKQRPMPQAQRIVPPAQHHPPVMTTTPMYQYLASPWLPMQPMPMHYVPQPTACCNRYMRWLTSIRKGRPPHDTNCYHRAGRNQNGIEKMSDCRNFNM